MGKNGSLREEGSKAHSPARPPRLQVPGVSSACKHPPGPFSESDQLVNTEPPPTLLLNTSSLFLLRSPENRLLPDPNTLLHLPSGLTRVFRGIRPHATLFRVSRIETPDPRVPPPHPSYHLSAAPSAIQSVSQQTGAKDHVRGHAYGNKQERKVPAFKKSTSRQANKTLVDSLW